MKNRTKRYENINIRRQEGRGGVMKAVGKDFFYLGEIFFRGRGFVLRLLYRQTEVKKIMQRVFLSKIRI